MRMIPRFCLLFFFLLLALRASAQAPSNLETFSENKQFSVEISTPQLDKPMLTVFSHSGGAPRHLWTRPLAPKDQDEDLIAAGIFLDATSIRTIVSNDGKTVILRPREAYSGLPAVRVLAQNGVDRSFEFEELSDFLSHEFDHPAEPQPLELLLDSEKPPLYALWFPPEAEWLVLDLEKLSLQKAEGALSNRLEVLALPRARELARLSRPTGLKKLLQPVLQKAGEFVPGLMPQNPFPTSFYDFSEPAYRFLAYKKNPEDRKLIQGLLEGDLEFTMSVSGFGSEPADFEVSIGLRSHERALADELLAVWEGKPLEDEEGEAVLLNPSGAPKKLVTLGQISGQVHLPIAVPNNARGIWIYLIPAGVEKGKWQRADSVLKVSYNPNDVAMSMPGVDQEPIDHVNFQFDTLHPGEYRLKAVWDRRPPYASSDQTAICIPEAGDYESAESDLLKLAPGQSLTDIVLHCTNRVGRAEEYFAADELWKKQQPARSSSVANRDTPAGRLKPKTLVNATVPEWVIQTNENNAGVELKRIDFFETTANDAELRRTLRILFRGPKLKSDDLVMLRARLVDDHGCIFETTSSSASGRTQELTFHLLPYSSRQMVLRLSREDFEDLKGRPLRNGPKETLLAAFTLTNLFGLTPAHWNADGPRPTRDLDLVTVELSEFDPENSEYLAEYRGIPVHVLPGFPGAGSRSLPRPQNKFTFTSDAKPAPGWRKIDGLFMDRWENASRSLAAFCREEEIFKYLVSIARDPAKGTFLPNEKLEIPIARVPGPGETLPIGIQKALQGFTFEVFSVGGTGEFTYRNGNFVSAKKEFPEEDFVPHLRRGRAVQPRIFLKTSEPGGSVDPLTGRPLRARNEITLGTKTPHVACRVPEPAEDTVFALLEQDLSIQEPMNAQPDTMSFHHYFPHRRHSDIQFLPLDFRAGDTDRKLTFVVQKTRKAEFFVRVPKGTR